ncbi:MAG: glycosyltransferase family 2 protein [Oscillospiraceae bacterium]|nr:glycosyltransferase family 2 protein [Oscillospiraceae bacterium]
METVKILNGIIGALFVICYSYQFVYTLAAVILKKPLQRKADAVPRKLHSYAVLIAARNEEAVIGNLIKSIREQDYPGELVKIFVVADNCADKTALVAKNAGATVYTRQNNRKIGKGYALDYLLEQIRADFGEAFDGYFVFDADNLLEPDYISEMNKIFSQGYRVVTGYRNSKNYASNWISAGYSLWFIRQSQFLDRARYFLGTSCNISGTGFLVSREIFGKTDGWKWFLLTEDIEFNAFCITNGIKIGYCERAVLYDEQPVGFRQSVRQRLRWSKGQLQVFTNYGVDLVKSVFTGAGKGSPVTSRLGAYDMVMSVSPAFVLSVAEIIVGAVGIFLSLGNGGTLLGTVLSIFETILGAYGLLFAIGIITTALEWRKIHAKAVEKVLYAFTFPIFMLTYAPIAFMSLFMHVEWKPIEHKVGKTIQEMRKDSL